MKQDKEKPAATGREQLAAVQDALGELPHQYDVEFIESEPAVYVNFDFSVAVVIEMGDPDIPEYAGMFVLVAYEWAADHGVKEEHFIGMLADAKVAAQVAVQFAKDHERI